MGIPAGAIWDLSREGLKEIVQYDKSTGVLSIKPMEECVPKEVVQYIESAFDNFREWFFFWTRTVLSDLATEAFSLYCDIKNAIDDEGNLKDFANDKFKDFFNGLSHQGSFEDCFKFIDSVYEYDECYQEEESLFKLGLCCWLLDKTISDNTLTKKDNIVRFMMYDRIVITTTSMAIGYWTTKGNIKNAGAEAMKERRKKNVKAISEILEAMKINDTSIFRADKDKRKKFFNQVKEKTDLTSEDRIFRLSREHIKKKKSKS